MKNKDKYYEMEKEEVLKILNTNKDGLTNKEAQKRLIENGNNKLDTLNKASNFKKFFLQFNDLMIIVLLISALVSFVISYINKEPFTDGIIIISIVILNAIMGFVQEKKADKSIENLQKLSKPKAKVKRDNKTIIVNTEELVIGDIIYLEAGDYISADARIIWDASLKVEEASLTGESVPSEKSSDVISIDVPLSERYNMVYAGCNVVYGRALAVVVKTGMKTELGKIAKSLTAEIKLETPLQTKINGISKVLSLIIAVIILIIFVIGIIKGDDFLEVLLLSISLAVAAIPEGLPAVITITLSLGMGVMAKKNAIVRKMSSVETLGSTEIICSDKTGTLTQNKMTVREIYFNGNVFDKLDSKIPYSEKLVDILALCNDVEKNSDSEYVGDPTEVALYRYLETIGLKVDDHKKKNERIKEIPFDSERKMMSTINQIDGELEIMVKGGLDSILDRCNKLYLNGKILDLTDKLKKEIKRIEKKESEKALRMLAFAYKKIKSIPEKNLIQLEKDLIFMGIVGMIDPPRDQVKNSIMECYKAGIKPIMITGDSLNTAIAVAQEIGILKDSDLAVEGIELDKYNDEELKEAVKKYSVYARVSPEHKLRIVKAWESNNKVVAMTGDGVNDAPALKSAHIGIGMGITGTEVSKGVSDIVLADDCFNTIVTAVKEGRRIYDNIRNVILYLLTANIAEVLIVFIAMLCNKEIFLPIHLLYINLITDSIPAIALAFEKESKGIMKRGVRKKDQSFFTPFVIARMSLSSIFKTIAILFLYNYEVIHFGIGCGTTMAFLCLLLLEMFFSLTCRNPKYTIINKDFFSNKTMNISMIILIVMQTIVFNTPIKYLFGITTLNTNQILIAVLVSLIIFSLDELSKPIIRKMFKD